jgi:hypothetical protein
VPVEVVIGIRGDLASPEPDFTLSSPRQAKSEIQYKLNDKDIRQTQALFFKSTGGFLSPEEVSQTCLVVCLNCLQSIIKQIMKNLKLA